MKSSFGSISLLLLLISLAMLLVLTLFESRLLGLPTFTERIIGVIFLVLPSTAGLFFGILSLRRKEPYPWIAITGIFLNGAFAIFNLLVISFAG